LGVEFALHYHVVIDDGRDPVDGDGLGLAGARKAQAQGEKEGGAGEQAAAIGGKGGFHRAVNAQWGCSESVYGSPQNGFFPAVEVIYAFAQGILDIAAADAAQSPKLQFEEHALVVLEGEGRVIDAVDQVIVQPAPPHHPEAVATAGVFEAGKRIQFPLVGEVVVLTAEYSPAGADGPDEGQVALAAGLVHQSAVDTARRLAVVAVANVDDALVIV